MVLRQGFGPYCRAKHGIDNGKEQKGHAMDITETQILHVKSEVSDIQHNMLPILKYLGIIG